MNPEYRRTEWENWRKEMEEASKDPLYLADIEEIEREFAYADAEAARMIDIDEEGPESGTPKQ